MAARISRESPQHAKRITRVRITHHFGLAGPIGPTTEAGQERKISSAWISGNILASFGLIEPDSPCVREEK